MKRVLIVGPSGSGKSTLAVALHEASGAPVVELDALNWQPGWQALAKEQLEAKVSLQTRGESWLLVGNYFNVTTACVWARADTLIWLDFPLWLCLWRVLTRSWRRWWRRELLWGTNVERFWPQLCLWDPERSLLAWTYRMHPRYRAQLPALLDGAAGRHLRVIRLGGPAALRGWLAELSQG